MCTIEYITKDGSTYMVALYLDGKLKFYDDFNDYVRGYIRCLRDLGYFVDLKQIKYVDENDKSDELKRLDEIRKLPLPVGGCMGD